LRRTISSRSEIIYLFIYGCLLCVITWNSFIRFLPSPFSFFFVIFCLIWLRQKHLFGFFKSVFKIESQCEQKWNIKPLAELSSCDTIALSCIHATSFTTRIVLNCCCLACSSEKIVTWVEIVFLCFNTQTIKSLFPAFSSSI